MNTTDALEAAKLAAMVGGQLKKIDQFSTERTNNPANKININNFIASVKNPRVKPAPARYLVEPPAGFAPPPPEEYVQSQVPDTSVGALPVENTPNIPAPAPILAPTLTHEPAQATLNNTECMDILKNIDKTLSSMLAYMKKDSSDE
jgi:hypothetical protein